MNAKREIKLPVIYSMSIKATQEISQQLLEDGHPRDTPVAFVFNAGGKDEKIRRTTLGALSHQKYCAKQPGLIIVGDITTYPSNLGALHEKKILLTCSAILQEKASACVRDFGGQPIVFPLIRLQRREGLQLRCATFDWIVVTSPSSVRAFMQFLEEEKIDLRSIPKIMVCGRGSADEFAKYGLHVDAQPEVDFSAVALIELAKKNIKVGDHILRIRSDKAGPHLAEALREIGAEVEDAVMYDNVRITHSALPNFDVIVFASASAVKSFIEQWGSKALAGKTISVIGRPTTQALEKQGLAPDIIAREATLPGVIQCVAEYFVARRIQELSLSDAVLCKR